jgi:hypothetical protein
MACRDCDALQRLSPSAGDMTEGIPPFPARDLPVTVDSSQHVLALSPENRLVYAVAKSVVCTSEYGFSSPSRAAPSTKTLGSPTGGKFRDRDRERRSGLRRVLGRAALHRAVEMTRIIAPALESASSRRGHPAYPALSAS